jgi:hypothetical protein
MKNIDRQIWKTSHELKDEFRYSTYSSVTKIVKENRIAILKNPESNLPHTILINRDEFIKIPKVFRRLIGNDEMERYNAALHLRGDWMIFGDCQIPLHDPELMERMQQVAEKYRIKKGINVGDLTELDAFKPFPGSGPSWEYEKAKVTDVLKWWVSYFDETVLLMGNHELRMWKRLHGMGEEGDIWPILLSEEKSGRVKASTYPYAVINESWLVTHPQSYSRIAARNNFTLASKYMIKLIEKSEGPNDQYGLIGFHGHLGGGARDISGRFQVVDGMGLMDPEKVMYKMMRINTYPEWCPGFFMLLNNHIYPFPKDSTDWEFWLK